jgi:hypothetical protein
LRRTFDDLASDLAGAGRQRCSRRRGPDRLRLGVQDRQRRRSPNHRVSRPGEYRLQENPEAIIGTWWVDAEFPVIARIRPAADLKEPLEKLTGRTVTIDFKDRSAPSLSGTLLKLGDADPADTGKRIKLLGLRMEARTVWVSLDDVRSVRAPGEPIVRLEPEFRLQVGPFADGKPKVARLGYLTRGMMWRANYRIDLSDPKSAKVTQVATIRNELAELTNTEVRLISGATAFRNENMLAELFAPAFRERKPNELDRDGAVGLGGALGGGNAGQAGLGGAGFGGFGGGGSRMVRAPDALLQGAGAAGAQALQLAGQEDGTDLHEKPVGRLTIEKGETLAVTVGSMASPYERLVEWLPAGRDGTVSLRTRALEGDTVRQVNEATAAWDVVRIRNPFPFPMTAGLVTFAVGPRLLGQADSFFLSPGETSMLPTSKTLSIVTNAFESLEKAEKADRTKSTGFLQTVTEEVWTRTWKGTLQMRNLRAEAVPVLIRHTVRGTILDATDEPGRVGRTDRGGFQMPVTELSWTITLKPGEVKEVSYRYQTVGGREEGDPPPSPKANKGVSSTGKKPFFDE